VILEKVPEDTRGAGDLERTQHHITLIITAPGASDKILKSNDIDKDKGDSRGAGPCFGHPRATNRAHAAR
jgi:hypothetical protein